MYLIGSVCIGGLIIYVYLRTNNPHIISLPYIVIKFLLQSPNTLHTMPFSQMIFYAICMRVKIALKGT